MFQPIELEIYDYWRDFDEEGCDLVPRDVSGSSFWATRITFFFKFSRYFLVHSFLSFFFVEAALGLAHQLGYCTF